MDNVFDFVKSLAGIELTEAFDLIKQDSDFSNMIKNEAPYYLQPEGRIYLVYSYDFYFKTGDVISYTVKEFSEKLPIRTDGNWDCYSDQDTVWCRYKDGDFHIHDTFLKSRTKKPIESENG